MTFTEEIMAHNKLVTEQKQKIKELEQENNKLLDVINNQDVKIADLEQQIEKMRCCQNCENWNWKHNKCEKKLKGDCFKQSKWVLRKILSKEYE